MDLSNSKFVVSHGTWPGEWSITEHARRALIKTTQHIILTQTQRVRLINFNKCCMVQCLTLYAAGLLLWETFSVSSASTQPIHMKYIHSVYYGIIGNVDIWARQDRTCLDGQVCKYTSIYGYLKLAISFNL